jgi:predicted TIM-barrel fold metal-dependent hydrolase
MNEENTPVAFLAPAQSCDAHFHVFGPKGAYPYHGKLRYEPPHAPLEDYLSLARKLGISRHVFVQPSAYGRDNRCMLDAMRDMPRDITRGIVDLEDNTPDSELVAMHALGVRGLRINVSPVHPVEEGLMESMLPRIQYWEARCLEHGWHLDFLLPGWLTERMLPVFDRLRIDHSLAHMGMFLAKSGPAQPGFQNMIALAGRGNGKTWIKWTGTYRMATLPHMQDARAMAQAVLQAAPDRIIWGSDYPHLSFADKVGSVQLFNLLHDWAPDPAHKKKVLVDNPAQLFGFV